LIKKAIINLLFYGLVLLRQKVIYFHYYPLFSIIDTMHISFQRGISKIDYFKARRRLILLSFTCRPCKSSEPATDGNAAADEHDQSTTSDHLPEDPETSAVSADAAADEHDQSTTFDHLHEDPETSAVSADVSSESIGGTVHSTMINVSFEKAKLFKC
jgi:hypothetical protein